MDESQTPRQDTGNSRVTIWALADIHASPLDDSGRPEKPMHIFGPQWENHIDRIESAWQGLVGEEDTVIVAGDLDWSLKLPGAIPTLKRLATWKGDKILVRGNHDYWWSSGATGKVRAVLPDGIRLLHNNAFQVEDFNIVGCKGSPVPGGPEWTDIDAKLLNRETERLKLSLAARDVSLPSIVALHYPPLSSNGGPTPYTQFFAESGVKLCVYGHLHAEASRAAVEGGHGGVEYRLVAADHVGFRPVPIGRAGVILAGDEITTDAGRPNR